MKNYAQVTSKGSHQPVKKVDYLWTLYGRKEGGGWGMEHVGGDDGGGGGACSEGDGGGGGVGVGGVGGCGCGSGMMMMVVVVVVV